MDYEKEYKKLKAGISKAYLYAQTDSTKAVLETIFPELKESEDVDEKIREEIIATIHLYYGEPLEDEAKEMITWLEKQGNKSVNIDIESMVSSYEQRLKSQGQGNLENNPLINMCLSAFKHGVENTLEELNLKKLEKQDEQKPILDFKAKDWYVSKVDGKIHNMTYNPTDKVELFDKYEGLTDFERTLTDICIGWIGKEIGWKQYIKDNADVLLKIAIKKFNSVQDVPFEQKTAWSEEDERNLEGIIDEIEANKNDAPDYDIKTYDRFLNWLKSLKNRITWKPSEEQFIDKACQYLRINRYNVRTEDNGIAGWIDDSFIEDFKNYMQRK